MSTALSAGLAAGGLLLVLLIRFALSTLRPHGFPPGPPTFPGLGNLHQIPLTVNFLQFTSWARQYGPILGLKLGPKNLIILSKASDVRSLWVQRGAAYAARPQTAIACDYALPDDHHRQVAFMTPEFHKVQRAAIKSHLGSAGFEKMRPIQQAFAARLMKDLLDDPDDFPASLLHWSLGSPLYSKQLDWKVIYVYTSVLLNVQYHPLITDLAFSDHGTTTGGLA